MDETLEKAHSIPLPMIRADVNTAQKVENERAGNLSTSAPRKKYIQHRASQKYRPLVLHCCQSNLGKAVTPRRGCSADN